MKERDVTNTSVKIPTGLLQRIDDDIASTNDFRNRSEWIIAAIRSYEEQRTTLLANRKIAQKENEPIVGNCNSITFETINANK